MFLYLFSLKVECINNNVGLRVDLFDFTINDFSGLFRSSCFSAKRFVNRFDEVVWNKKDSPDTNEDEPCDNPIVIEVIDVGLDKQKTTKRKLPSPEMESPPVPKRKTMKGSAENNSGEDTSCSDVKFLQEMSKHAVQGKLICNYQKSFIQ